MAQLRSESGISLPGSEVMAAFEGHSSSMRSRMLFLRVMLMLMRMNGDDDGDD